MNNIEKTKERTFEELTANELIDRLIKNYESMIDNLKEEINCYKRINNVHKFMLELKLGTVIDQELIDALYPKETDNNEER